jgi:tetratricopeptide (TPR) repeat protein
MKNLIFILLFCIGFSGAAQQSSALFEGANQAYADGNYGEAVASYKRILENGETSAALHYNLGNAYYKLNEIANSIYHFEKALQLEPGDEDIQNNLEFARNMAIDAIQQEEPKGFLNIFDSTTAAFSIAGWGWIGIFCVLGFVLFFLVYYFSERSITKRISFITGIFFLLMAVTSVIIATTKQDIQQNNDFAIIFSKEVEVRNEPNVRANEVFTLHEGAKVRITEDFQGWVEIELPNGNEGWIEASNLKRL